jgi:hypothetical protein
MNSKELAEKLNITDRYIRTLTKKAIDSGIEFIELGGKKINFKLVNGVGGRGKVYEYELIEEVKRVKRRKSTVSKVDVGSLPTIDFSSVSLEDKLTIVKFIKKSGSSIRAISKVYALNSDLKEGAIYKRLSRWLKAYEEKGKAGLVDKRGGSRGSKIDDSLFIASISKSANLYTYYSRYAYLEAKKRGVAFDVLKPESSCSISYSGYVKHFNKVKNDPHIKAILSGLDRVNELVPKFKIEVNYPNEVWEIDATKIDVFVKVPVIDGEVNYFRKVESSDYVLKRYALVGVVDRFSKARVYSLFLSDTSYSDVRLLEKAINVLGKPEIIRGDNGKNYVSKHFGDVLDELGIIYEATNPYAGYEKPFVERGFRSLQHNYLFEGLPGFIGHNTKQRGNIEDQAAAKSLKGKSGVGTQTHIKEEFMWWWEAERVIDGLIEHKFSKEMSVHKQMIKELNIPKNLHKMLGKKVSRKVGMNGVYINKEYYLSKELWSYFSVGDMVEVYEEIDDVNIAYIKLESGEFLEIRNRNIYKLSVEEAKAIKKAYKNRKIKVIKEGLKLGKESRKEMSEVIVEELEKLSSIAKEDIKKVVKDKESKEIEDAAKSLLDLAKIAGY